MPSERKPPPIDTGYGVADEDMTYGVEDSVSDSEMVSLSTADRRLIVSALWWVRQTQPTTPMAVEMEALMGRLEAADDNQ